MTHSDVEIRIVRVMTPRKTNEKKTFMEEVKKVIINQRILLLLLLLCDMDVSCHRPFLPGTSLEPAVIPIAQASNFTLQYFPYYV
jgi:hypothetical protein